MPPAKKTLTGTAAQTGKLATKLLSIPAGCISSSSPLAHKHCTSQRVLAAEHPRRARSHRAGGALLRSADLPPPSVRSAECAAASCGTPQLAVGVDVDNESGVAYRELGSRPLTIETFCSHR